MPDLVLLHAPSVYDFRRKTILYGPVSDLVPPSAVFEMYPIGFASIAEYLERAGYRVRIANLAVRMLRNRNFDAEGMLKRLNAGVFGIDLHWLVHAHGVMEIARLVKKYHPQAKVLLGGFSASYYYRELMGYPEIDFIIRGDSAEEPTRQLLDCLKKGNEPEAVPNLVWRDRQGNVRENPFTHIPTEIENVMVGHYDNIVRSVVRHRDLLSYLPFRDWLRYPITAVLTCRGCTQNCVICGGSAAAFRDIYHRPQPVYRSPQAVSRDIKEISRFSNGPIFVLGDLRQPGEDYAQEVFRRLRESRVKNQLIFELFVPASREYLERLSQAAPRFCLEISPESHDLEVRQASGKSYSTEALEQTLGDALAAGCGRLDVFFMIGLSHQTPQSALDTVEFCGEMWQRFKGDRRLSFFTAPVAPFLDPGSLGFEYPERYGYRLRFRSFEEHRKALASPSWKYFLNYETEWMNRDQLVATTYEALLRLNTLKAKYGLLSPEKARLAERRLKDGLEILGRIDDIVAQGSPPEELAAIKPEVDRINLFPATEKVELELPVGLVKLKPWRYLGALFRR